MPPRKAARFDQSIIAVFAPLLWPVLSIAVIGVIANYNIATKPYVDDGLKAQQKYTDDKSAQSLSDANNHADRNHDALMIKLQQQTSEINTVGTKVDWLVDISKRAAERNADRK
jgi:hypothetical protein